MNRVIKRAVILFGVFAAALLAYFFLSGRDSGKEQVVYVDMGEASLPAVSVEMFGRKTNPMAGYVQEVDNRAAGNSLTVLPEDRALTVLIEKGGDAVTGISYEIRTMDRERLIERTALEQWEQNGEEIRAVLPIQNLLNREQEYLLRLDLNTEQHGMIHYYTRILWIENEGVSAMLDLAADFSARTFDYTQAKELTTYLETSPSEDNSSFGTASIRSSFSHLTWGDLDMQPASQVQVTLKELDGIMSCVQLTYLAERKNGEDDTEYYQVEENFTMKWNSLRIYLMDYDRQVNQIFQGKQTDYAGKRILLGITRDERVEVKKSPDGNILAYRVNRDLWSYDQKEQKGAKVFSFRSSDVTDPRNYYGQHDISILSVEDSGDVDFLVYGYMNRGNHEGSMGIVGYHYDSGQNALEELYYIPYTGSYEALEDDLQQLVYRNDQGMLYLYVDHAVYGIDLKSRENIVVADALEEGSYAVSADRSRIAWQAGGSRYDSESLSLMDLNTGEKREIRGESGKYVRVLGFVGSDLVYGTANKEDVWMDNGRVRELPMESIRIINDQMQEETSYEKPGYYISQVRVEESRIHLSRVSKTGGGGYTEAQPDTIVCNVSMGPGNLEGIGWYASADKGKVYFVQLSQEIRSSRNVRISVPKKIRDSESDILELKSNYQVKSLEFYAYSGGHLQKTTTDFSEAMQMAYEKMGVVTDSNHRILWSRVNRGPVKNIKDPASVFAPVERQLESFTDSCVLEDGLMILDARGCSMQQLLYFIDQNMPVLGFTENGGYLLLCGFDQYNVTVYDPASGETYKAGLNDSTEFFRRRGNDFICAVWPR